MMDLQTEGLLVNKLIEEQKVNYLILMFETRVLLQKICKPNVQV